MQFNYETLIEQLGGSKFIAMTGAKNFVHAADRLTFKIGRGAVNRATHCTIRLGDTDTYTITFKNIRGVKIRDISVHRMIYAEMLRKVFEEQTGMATSL